VPEWKIKEAEPEKASSPSVPTWVRTAVIAGGAGGGALLLVGLAVCMLFAAAKRRKQEKRQRDQLQADEDWCEEAGAGGSGTSYTTYKENRRPGGKPRQGQRERDSRDRTGPKPAVNTRRSWLGAPEAKGRHGRDWEGTMPLEGHDEERRRQRAEQEGRRKGGKYPREGGRLPSKEPSPWGGAASPREPSAGFFREVTHEGGAAPHLLIPAGRNSSMEGPGRRDGGSPGAPNSGPTRGYGGGDRYAGMPVRSHQQRPGPYADEGDEEGWLPGTPKDLR
jgi:hypothetical protein